MEKKQTIFDFLGQIIFIFGISVACLCVFCMLFGANAKRMSTIFALGNEGLAISTILQFFAMAVVISAVRWIFFSDVVLKDWSIFKRTVGMFVLVIVMIGIFAAVFGWFPVNEPTPWIMFFLCFAVCSAISITLSVTKEKKENEKMQEALERLKRGEM
ncbi:MAG: DUF3021 family protein [Lachnospiraceae bacterium]|nr:DUF3021 family protein [Lachnospiraceae bacterium]